MNHPGAPRSERPIFVGCACDKAFVEPTAVMLTSLQANGDVADATILVAGFGLDRMDRAALRAGAGDMARRTRFIDVTGDMLDAVDGRRFTASYPTAVLGRLFIAGRIKAAGARLLTLDSDMIVNASLRPLFDLDLGDVFFAAIHAPLRQDDLSYFNSGLLLLDVDAYRSNDVTARCLRWLAGRQAQPAYPDQDALNAVIGDRWHRLDRSWNYFCYGERRYTLQDYEGANVVHFAGPKPWNDPSHPGAPLYGRHLASLRARQVGKTQRSAIVSRLLERIRLACHF